MGSRLAVRWCVFVLTSPFNAAPAVPTVPINPVTVATRSNNHKTSDPFLSPGGFMLELMRKWSKKSDKKHGWNYIFGFTLTNLSLSPVFSLFGGPPPLLTVLRSTTSVMSVRLHLFIRLHLLAFCFSSFLVVFLQNTFPTFLPCASASLHHTPALHISPSISLCPTPSNVLSSPCFLSLSPHTSEPTDLWAIWRRQLLLVLPPLSYTVVPWLFSGTVIRPVEPNSLVHYQALTVFCSRINSRES